MSDQPIKSRVRVMPDRPAEIQDLSAELSIDKHKVRVSIRLSRDDTRPDLDLRLTDANGLEICHSTIVENIGPGMDFTLHIRSENVVYPLLLDCQLSYLEDKVHSQKTLTLMTE